MAGREERTFVSIRDNISVCKCGCGKPVKTGSRYIRGHSSRGRKLTTKHKQNISKSLMGHEGVRHTEKTKNKISKKLKGKSLSTEHRKNISIGSKGKRLSKEHKKNISMGRIMKYQRSDGYCQQWGDGEYKCDLRKDKCDNCNLTMEESLAKWGKKLHLHHKDGDKKNCHPHNIATLCVSCHALADWELRKKGYCSVSCLE